MDTLNPLEQSAKCPICGGYQIKEVISILQLPVHCHLLWSTKTEALEVARGDVVLGYCVNCSHIFNVAFDPELLDYSRPYENSLHFSPTFQAYAESLAERLVHKLDLYRKTIVEIGCGQGDFLNLLCRLGDNQGYGFDPSYIPHPEHQGLNDRVKIFRDYFSAKYQNTNADLVIARHVLEHVKNPRALLDEIAHAFSSDKDGRIFIEVPNALFTLRDLGIWDIIYEHCSYFSDHSLAYLLQERGFCKSDAYEAYGGQFLCIEVEKRIHEIAEGDPASQNDRHDMTGLVISFAQQYQSKVQSWENHLNRFFEAGKRIVLWGSGSKGITFLNTLNITRQIKYVVDINPRKHYNYVTGTGQQIIPPEFLIEYRPDYVIILNPIYRNEIERNLVQLGVNANIIQV